MADDSLIVPVLLANGSLHHPSVSSDALAQDLIGVLTAQEEVISSVLGELQDASWALQHIHRQPNGRKWEEAELEALGDGERCRAYILLVSLEIYHSVLQMKASSTR